MTNEYAENPIQTGGGGEHFEQQVAAYFLGLLLVRATPPILIDTSLVEVHLQTGHLGWCTDDVLLVGESSSGSRRQLGLQVKRRFTISANNEDCCKTIIGMWNDFRAVDRFNSSTDQLALVILEGTSILLHDFNSLIHCARSSLNAEDFGHRVSLDGYLSVKAKKQYRATRRILTRTVDRSLDNEEIRRFLSTINILNLDFNPTSAQAKANTLSLLEHTKVDESEPSATAHDTWASLLECAGEGRPAAKSFTLGDLPRSLRERHSPVARRYLNGLGVVVEHGQTVRAGIRRTIGNDYSIDRSSLVASLETSLQNRQVVIVSGVAGSGKSALVCDLIDQLSDIYPILSFHAVEFALPHIDETLANAYSEVPVQRLLDMLAAHARKIVFIDGVEKLLERSVRDAFVQLLELSRIDTTIKVLLTVRDYSFETVRDALIPSGMNSEVFQVPTLSDDELNAICDEIPALSQPLKNNQLRKLLRTPYLLDLASRLEWVNIAFPTSLKEFRRAIWKYVIRADDHLAGGLPDRRERMFLDIAWQRAVKLRSFVRPRLGDWEALDALRQDSLVLTANNSSALCAVTHDVLEDWCVIQRIDDLFVETEGSLSELSDAIGGYPALRRGFRQWLAEQFEINPDKFQTLVVHAIRQRVLPPFFRDDCLVAVLQSKSAAEFLSGCRNQIDRGDIELLERIVHMLRTACKTSPDWLDIPGLQSQMLVPTGQAWHLVLRMVSCLIETLLPSHSLLVLGLEEDWANQIGWWNRDPDGVKESGHIVDRLLSRFGGYETDDERKRTLKVVMKIPQSVPQFKEIIERAETCEYSDYTAFDLLQFVLTKPEASFVCQDFPDEVIALVRARLLLQHSDRNSERFQFRHAIDTVDYEFGIDDLPFECYFPPSALQGPFRALLRHHPQKAVPFIVALINHAADWYSNGQWPRERTLESATQTPLVVKGTSIKAFWCLMRSWLRKKGVVPWEIHPR